MDIKTNNLLYSFDTKKFRKFLNFKRIHLKSLEHVSFFINILKYIK